MSATETIAFVMFLKPGNEVEYQRRHDEIWPALSDALRDAGILDYQIYLHAPSSHLFAWQKRRVDHRVDELPGLPIMRQWWDYMADLMEVNPDHSPKVEALTRVFDFQPNQ